MNLMGGMGMGGVAGLGLGPGEPNGPVEERVLWSYVVQIANAMKEVHDAGLAFRGLDVSKVLVVGKNRCACHLAYFSSCALERLILRF